MALVGNILNPKIEEVSYEEGRTLAEEINAVLGYICTKKAIGIDELFHNAIDFKRKLPLVTKLKLLKIILSVEYIRNYLFEQY